jgi:hypothetical protein
MRRRIEVFQGFVNTSFFLLDPLFSSLPLPPAARGDSFCKNRPPWTPLQKLLIINNKNITAAYLHSTNPIQKKLLIVPSCNFAAKKNKLKGGSTCRHYRQMSHTCF